MWKSSWKNSYIMLLNALNIVFHYLALLTEWTDNNVILVKLKKIS